MLLNNRPSDVGVDGAVPMNQLVAKTDDFCMGREPRGGGRVELAELGHGFANHAEVSVNCILNHGVVQEVVARLP
jgi:hypothetical protein